MAVKTWSLESKVLRNQDSPQAVFSTPVTHACPAEFRSERADAGASTCHTPLQVRLSRIHSVVVEVLTDGVMIVL